MNINGIGRFDKFIKVEIQDSDDQHDQGEYGREYCAEGVSAYSVCMGYGQLLCVCDFLFGLIDEEGLDIIFHIFRIQNG